MYWKLTESREELKKETLISWKVEKDPGQLFRTSSSDKLVQQFPGVVAALKIQVSVRVAYIGSHYPSYTKGVWCTLVDYFPKWN